MSELPSPFPGQALLPGGCGCFGAAVTSFRERMECCQRWRGWGSGSCWPGMTQGHVRSTKLPTSCSVFQGPAANSGLKGDPCWESKAAAALGAGSEISDTREEKGCGMKTALVFPTPCDCPGCNRAASPWRWALMGLGCWWGSQAPGHPLPTVSQCRGHAVPGSSLRAAPASAHLPKHLERGIPRAQGCPEGRQGPSLPLCPQQGRG